MFAYLDYHQASTLDLRERRKQNNEAGLAARRNGALSPTGEAYAVAIAGSRSN
jgi:hypothetical protein